MSKIVVDAREWSSSSGRYISSLVRYLEQLDKNNQYTILLKPNDMDKYFPESPNFTTVLCPYKEFSFSEQLGFKRQLDSLNADLVHFSMVQQPVRYKGKTVTTMNDLTTIRFKNPSKNPLVFWVKQRIYAWLNHRVAKQTSHIITFTQFVKDDIIDYTGVERNKITPIHLSADPITDPAEPIAALNNKHFLMYVGRPTPHKNLERLIEAFILLKSTHPNLVLVLAGKKDANYRRIEADVTSRGVEHVYFTDFVSEGQLRWLYEHCAAYVFPSLSEGFGLPGLEAMIHNAPVVSSSATCLPEVYGNAAHYFDPLDTQNMADAINEVLTNKDLRQQLVLSGKQQVARFSWEKTAKETFAVYNKILLNAASS